MRKEPQRPNLQRPTDSAHQARVLVDTSDIGTDEVCWNWKSLFDYSNIQFWFSCLVRVNMLAHSQLWVKKTTNQLKWLSELVAILRQLIMTMIPLK